MRRLDYAHADGALLFKDLIAKRLHSDPMNLRPEVVLGVISVKKPDPVVKLVITTYAPGHRFIGIASVMTVIAVEIGETVAEVPKRQQKTNVVPVENPERDEIANEER